ncbi:MAG: ABC transporter permease [Dysgonamonadaceae bacterium]
MKSGFLAIAKREFRRIFSSKICIWGMLVVPVLSAAILMYMMQSGLPQKIPIAVVDLDNTSTTRTLIRQLDAFSKTDIKFKSLSFREARLRMESTEIYAILYIPRNFTRDAISGQQPKLVFYTDNAFYVSGNLLFQDLKTIGMLASASVGLKTALAKGFTEKQVMPILQPITVESHPLGNPWVNYSICLNTSLIPAIFQLLLFMFTVSAFGSEVKSGTGKKLMEMGNNNYFTVILGKTIPYTIIFLLLSLLMIALMYWYQNFPLQTGFWPVYLDYFLLIIASQGVGLIMVGVFQNYRMALSIASLFGMLAFSITGFSFPTEAMSPVLQAISNLFPMRHFFLISSSQALDGYRLSFVTFNIIALMCFAFVGLLTSSLVAKFLNSEYEE